MEEHGLWNLVPELKYLQAVGPWENSAASVNLQFLTDWIGTHNAFLSGMFPSLNEACNIAAL